MNKNTHHQHERKKGNNTEANKFLTGGVKKERKKERTGEWMVLAVTKTRTPKKTARQATAPHQANKNKEHIHKTPDTHTQRALDKV